MPESTTSNTTDDGAPERPRLSLRKPPAPEEKEPTPDTAQPPAPPPIPSPDAPSAGGIKLRMQERKPKQSEPMRIGPKMPSADLFAEEREPTPLLPEEPPQPMAPPPMPFGLSESSPTPPEVSPPPNSLSGLALNTPPPAPSPPAAHPSPSPIPVGSLAAAAGLHPTPTENDLPKPPSQPPFPTADAKAEPSPPPATTGPELPFNLPTQGLNEAPPVPELSAEFKEGELPQVNLDTQTPFDKEPPKVPRGQVTAQFGPKIKRKGRGRKRLLMLLLLAGIGSAGYVMYQRDFAFDQFPLPDFIAHLLPSGEDAQAQLNTQGIRVLENAGVEDSAGAVSDLQRGIALVQGTEMRAAHQELLNVSGDLMVEGGNVGSETEAMLREMGEDPNATKGFASLESIGDVKALLGTAQGGEAAGGMARTNPTAQPNVPTTGSGNAVISALAGQWGSDQAPAPPATGTSTREPAARPAIPPPTENPVAVVRTEDIPPPAPPSRTPDPALAQFLAENVQIQAVIGQGQNVQMIVGGVVYRPGDLVEAERGLRFAGMDPETDELVFIDTNEATYRKAQPRS